jgi:hypothetical protein
MLPPSYFTRLDAGMKRLASTLLAAWKSGSPHYHFVRSSFCHHADLTRADGYPYPGAFRRVRETVVELTVCDNVHFFPRFVEKLSLAKLAAVAIMGR